VKIRRKRTALVVGGTLILICLAVEVVYFGFTAFFTALGVWVVLVAPALAVTPRRGPEDELWLFGLIRELLHRLNGEAGGGGEAHPDEPEPVPPATSAPIVVPGTDPDTLRPEAGSEELILAGPSTWRGRSKLRWLWPVVTIGHQDTPTEHDTPAMARKRP
jgi:hypothetical protein